MPRRGRTSRLPLAWGFRRPWMRQAACRDLPPEILKAFYPPDAYEPTGRRLAREALAKAVCASCPVLTRCRQLVDSIEAGVPREHHHGIWAGENPTQRRWRRRRQDRPGVQAEGVAG